MVKEPAKPSQRNRLIAAAVLLIILLQGFFIYFYLIVPQGPFCWDEAHRSVFSLAMAKNLSAGDLPALWQLTNRQIYWPFLHSWASAVFLLIGGYSYPAARFMSLAMNAGAVFSLFLVARKAAGRDREVVGLIAVVLFVLSPIVVFFAATAMAESLGILLTLLTLLSYLAARERTGPGRYLLTGFLLALLSFTKYIYAIFFGFGLFLFWASLLVTGEDRRRGRSELLRSWLVAAAFLACWLLWLAGGLAGQKIGIIIYRFGDTGGWDFLQLGLLDRILYYPRALLGTYTFSPWIFIIYAGGIIWSLCNWRDLKVRLLLLLFIANLAPMAQSVNLQERFIVTSIPCLYILSSMFLMRFWDTFNNKRNKIIFLFVFLVLISGDLHKLPTYIRTTGNNTIGVMNFKAPKQRNRSTLFGAIHYPNFLAQKKNLLNLKFQGPIPTHNIEDIYQFIWNNTDPRAGICALFQLNESSPHLWLWHSLARNQPIFNTWNPNCYYFISLQLTPISIYRTMVNLTLLEGEGRTEDGYQFLEGLTKSGFLNVLTKQSYSDMGMTITIYTRAVPVNDSRWQAIRFK